MKTNKKWEPKYTKFINELICILRREMFLHKYKIGTSYAKEPKQGKEEEVGTVTAEIKVNSTYYFADIVFYPNAHDMWKKKDKDGLIEVVIHEMCHILNNPLTDLAEKSQSPATEEFVLEKIEQSTQHLAVIISAFLRETHPKLFK